jgi:hypothetical protein
MFHDPWSFPIISESGGPSGTRILSLPQHDLRRETGPVSTCYMSAVKAVEEESGISRQRARNKQAF